MASASIEIRYVNPYTGERSPTVTVLKKERAVATERLAKPVAAVKEKGAGADAAAAVGGLAVGYVAYSGLMLVAATAMLAFWPLSLVLLACAAMGGGSQKSQRYYGRSEV